MRIKLQAKSDAAFDRVIEILGDGNVVSMNETRNIILASIPAEEMLERLMGFCVIEPEEKQEREGQLHVCLYGGSFNPPHCGHVMTALWALQTMLPDKVLVVPTFQHNFGKSLISFEHRLEMTRLAFEPLQWKVEVSDVERDLGKSLTANTVRHLLEEYTAQGLNPRITVLLGSDIADDLPQWEGYEELCSLAEFQIIDRNLFAPAISSTKIRRELFLADEESGRYLEQVLPANVLKYIYDHNLFQELGQ